VHARGSEGFKVKKPYIAVFGISNKHGRKGYSFFADYDNEPLSIVKFRAKRVLKESGAPYAAIIQSNKKHYHLYVPGFFQADEVMRLFWHAKCDPWYSAFFMKHRRNVLRWTKKERTEPVMRCIWEERRDSDLKIPLELCVMLDELFNCNTPRSNLYANTSIEFSEYRMRPNGRKYYNKFLSPKGLNKRVKEVLRIG